MVRTRALFTKHCVAWPNLPPPPIQLGMTKTYHKMRLLISFLSSKSIDTVKIKNNLHNIDKYLNLHFAQRSSPDPDSHCRVGSATLITCWGHLTDC